MLGRISKRERSESLRATYAERYLQLFPSAIGCFMISRLLRMILTRQRRIWIYLSSCLRDVALSRAGERHIRDLVSTGKPIMLELGAGQRRGANGWITADIREGADIRLDVLDRFPFPDSSVELVYASHFLEHFSWREAQFVLAECLRVLKAGGLLKLAVPDAKIYLDVYRSPETFDPDVLCSYAPAYRFHSKIDYVNYIAYMGGVHKHMFDRENLVAVLKANGFHNVRERAFDPELDSAARDCQSIYAKGEKPL